GLAYVEDEPRSLDERVCPLGNGRRSGMCRAPLEGDCAAGLRAHHGDDAERLAEAREHRTLLDMGFDEGIRKLLQPPAAHRSRLLGAESNHDQRRLTEAVGGLDRRNDSERAVEAPPIGNRVEM